MSLLLLLVVPFLAAILAGPLHRVAPGMAGPVLAAVPAALFMAFLTLGSGAPVLESLPWVPAFGIELSFRLDGFSRLFALLVTGIGALVVLYASAYFRATKPERSGAFLTLILLFMTAMLGTVLADDLVAMFVFWEATSLLSYLLIGFDSKDASARKAALQSLIVTAGGGLALLAGILMIGAVLGTFSLSEVAERSDELVASPLAVPIMVLILVGAFAKSAQVPFHFWLPAAMAAPTPASAYLHSATMVKLGVYLLARFDAVFADMPAFGTVLVVFGSATMLVAAVRALSSDGYKAVLAQSTVGSLGVLVMLIGLDGDLAVTAMIGFLLAHALYKAALFFCAGIAIHATHEKALSKLGSLRGSLPLTALAAALAGVSMAGLPPTLGFISKEYLFEGQLESSSGWTVLVVAVLVNAVFVAIAGLAVLKPFLSRAASPTVHHGESAGLVAGPLVLGALGLLFGVFPGLIVASLMAPAVEALLGRPVPVSFSLWHGWTLMLALSTVVVALGAAIFLGRDVIHRRLSSLDWLERLTGERGYDIVFGGTLRLAEASTRFLQNGDQRRYSVVVLTAVLATMAAALLAAGALPRFDLASGRFDIGTAIVLVLICIGALAAARSLSLLRSLIAVGVAGFGSAAVFMLNGAPDLALTQFSVEVLVVVILISLLLRVRDDIGSTRTGPERRVDAVLAGGFGLVLFLGLATSVTAPLDMTLTDYFAATSYKEAFGRNVVNVILVDYRAIDTMGEIAVVGFAAIGVWGLLRATRSRKERA